MGQEFQLARIAETHCPKSLTFFILCLQGGNVHGAMPLIEQLTWMIPHMYAQFYKCRCVKEAQSKKRKGKKKGNEIHSMGSYGRIL